MYMYKIYIYILDLLYCILYNILCYLDYLRNNFVK